VTPWWRNESVSTDDESCGELVRVEGAGGESPAHRLLKEYIYSVPDIALRDIGGGPFLAREMERWFETYDEVDVWLTDASGAGCVG
jgi:hypothetical protein